MQSIHNLKLLIVCCAIAYTGFNKTLAQSVALHNFIHAALNNSPVLRAAAGEYSVSGKEISMARSQRYATVSLEGNTGFANEFKAGNNYTSSGVRLYMEQTIWQNRKVDAAIQQAKYKALIAASSFKVTKQDLILAVKTVYYNCQQLYELFHIAVDNRGRASVMLDYDVEQSQLGIGRKSDVLKAESDWSQAEYEEQMYFNAFRNSQNDLIALTGLSPGYEWTPDTITLTEPYQYNLQSADSLIQTAVLLYPELQVAQYGELYRQEQVKIIKAGLFPILSINSGYEWIYNPAFQQQNNWLAMLTLRWKLFNGKEKQYQLQSEQIKTEIFSNQTELIRINLFRDISNWLIELNDARQQMLLFQSLKKTTLEGHEAAKAQYMAGTGSLLELTDARITDLLANKNYIQAITKYRISMAKLERLTGKIYENESDE
jgi:outer membrane protein TolC